MKKLLYGIIIFLVVLLNSGYLRSQSLQFVKPTVFPDTIVGKAEDWELTSSPVVKNVSNHDVLVRMVVAPLKLATGHLFSFCDLSTCYPPATNMLESPNPFTLHPGENTGNWLHIYIYPNGTEGTSELSVRFYNVDNPDDGISYKVVYFVGTQDVDEEVSYNLLDVFPNPTRDILSLDLRSVVADEIVVFDVNGNQIYRTRINGESFVVLNVVNFSAGTYFYSIIFNGNVETSGSFVVIR